VRENRSQLDSWTSTPQLHHNGLKHKHYHSKIPSPSCEGANKSYKIFHPSSPDSCIPLNQNTCFWFWVQGYMIRIFKHNAYHNASLVQQEIHVILIIKFVHCLPSYVFPYFPSVFAPTFPLSHGQIKITLEHTVAELPPGDPGKLPRLHRWELD
jgi:hypothetical protein